MHALGLLPSVEEVLARDPVAEVYLDGSALSRYLPAAPEARAWSVWVAEHEPAAVVTQVSVLEARVTAGFLGGEAVLALLEALVRLPRMRLSDQALRRAALLPEHLAPFTALHVGAAQAHAGVRALATYDPVAARTAALVGLDVVTPGRPAGWWQD